MSADTLSLVAIVCGSALVGYMAGVWIESGYTEMWRASGDYWMQRAVDAEGMNPSHQVASPPAGYVRPMSCLTRSDVSRQLEGRAEHSYDAMERLVAAPVSPKEASQ